VEPRLDGGKDERGAMCVVARVGANTQRGGRSNAFTRPTTCEWDCDEGGARANDDAMDAMESLVVAVVAPKVSDSV
jgi:hypothetical protein